jgi:putative acetyltransferase
METPRHVPAPGSAAFEVRRAVPADAEAVRRVHGASIRELCAADYTPEQLEAWASPARIEQYQFAIARHEFYVAFDVAASSQRVIGFSELDRELGEVKAVYVDALWSRRGVGRALLAELERAARGHQLTQLQLEASLNAEAFYLAAGYRSVARRTHILSSGDGVPCVEMRKLL